MPSKRDVFKSEKTRKAFMAWVNEPGGLDYHPCNRAAFFQFVKTYYLEKEELAKEQFEKLTEGYVATPKTQRHGIRQRHYNELKAIVEFLKSIKY